MTTIGFVVQAKNGPILPFLNNDATVSEHMRDLSKFPINIRAENYTYEDLGLLTSSNLSWNSHLDSITAKANKALGLVKRTCMDFKDFTRLRTLYRSLVRPLPKYSCETWNPQTQRNYNRIEAIQRRATKFILKYNEDYNIRLKRLDLQSL